MEMHGSFARWRAARLEQFREQTIRVAPDHNRLAVMIANQFATADKWFQQPLDGASPCLLFESIRGNLLSFIPGCGKGRICSSQLVDTGAARTGDSRRGAHNARLGKRLEKTSLARLGEFQFSHGLGLPRTPTRRSGKRA